MHMQEPALPFPELRQLHVHWLHELAQGCSMNADKSTNKKQSVRVFKKRA